jgi:nucleoside-diphosphate-sugar epimerase
VTAAPPGPVLVTGATGFIGGRLVERLFQEGAADVRVLVRHPARAVRVARFPVGIVTGSVTDDAAVTAAVRGCRTVFHCAHDSGSPRRNHASGVDGTRMVGEAAVRAGVTAFVHLSSYAVYGSTPDGDLREGEPWAPSDHPYVVAKREGEQVVGGLHRSAGLPAVILQPTIVYGPYGKAWTVAQVDALRAGRVPLVDGGRGLANVVYVDDVVDAMLAAARRPGAAGKTLLVSGPRPVTWLEYYRAFEAALGRSATVFVEADDIGRLRREERRRVRRAVTGAVRSSAAAVLREPEVRRLREGPVLSRMADTVQRRVSDERWSRWKASLGGSDPAAAARATPDPERPVLVPDDLTLALYRSRTTVRVDRAAEVLGWRPRVSFEEGMDLTTQYLRWARLV